jgi:CRP-like cAMP-binding protein
MFEKRVSAGEDVIRQGDEGDNFYIIDNGQFDVFVDDRKVITIGDGGSFGELALMYNAPRAATVRAVVDSVLWAVDRQTFRRILMDTTSRKRRMYESFLLEVPILQSLTSHERSKVADSLEPLYFSAGEIIIREGDGNANSFYIVEEGECTAFKKNKNGDDDKVAEITKGGYFGELALLTDKPRAASVVAKTAVKCVILDRASFVRLMGPCVDILKRNTSVYEKVNAEHQLG